MDCKDVGKLLTSYLDGELTKEEREIVELHLSACPHCRRELEALADTQNQLRQSFQTIAGKTPSAQSWARLQQRLTAEDQPGVTFFDLTRSKPGGIKSWLASRQPVWKAALAGALVVALIAGLVLIAPPHLGQTQEASAAEIAQNDPQIRELLPEGTVVRVMKIVKPEQGGIFHVLFLISGESVWGGENGGEAIMIDALVDVRERKVLELRTIRTVGAPVMALSVAERQQAIEIARADPGVQKTMDSGAVIHSVIPLPFSKPTDNSSPEKVVGVVLVSSPVPLPKTALKTEVQEWVAIVNLDEGKVVELIIK